MKRSIHLQIFLSLLLVFSMLTPVVTLAGDNGKKHFKIGMKHEEAEEWDKACVEFALAVSDDPKNPEYRLHLYRSLFHASQMYMKKGALAAKELDYEAGYLAFRRAYGFDPTNELAKSEMERMARLQKESVGGTPDAAGPAGGVAVVPAAFDTGDSQDTQIPQKLEKLRDLPFPSGVDIQFIIKELARDLDLNVLFDIESFRTPGRKTSIDLKNVTAARALDYIFIQEGLFFQKVGPRTILVALQTQRQKFQQLVLRTFYLANAAPKDIAKVVQTAIPAQPGRSQTIVLTDDATNSITIRDTEENIRLIGRLISSLDKDRAEVVMDIAIYEINKSDLLEFGNQIGTTGPNGTLQNLGGVGFPIVRAGPTGGITSGLPFTGADAMAIALGLPNSQFTALQNKSNTKLVASTQIHAFNNEDSSARIGQRVPVESAQFVTGTGTVVGGGGVVSNVINYEQVGLTFKFKPLVFPNQDVQVAMEIEAKDVVGPSTLTPTFTERSIKGTARIQNNKTLLVASVASDVESRGTRGLPLLGLIPILGRLFSVATRDFRKIDIVIAVTPRVIRAPAILPEDEIERPTGSLAVPTQNSLEAMIIEEDRNDMIAAARRIKNNVEVQLPDRRAEAPDYVRASGETQAIGNKSDSILPGLVPIDSGVKTLQLNKTSDIVKPKEPQVEAELPQPDSPTIELSLPKYIGTMNKGERRTIAVSVEGAQVFRSAVLGLKFDDKKLMIRSLSSGELFGLYANAAVTPFLNQNGKMFVSLTAPGERILSPSGSLLFIEIEALEEGVPVIEFESEVLNFLAPDGKNIIVKFGRL